MIVKENQPYCQQCFRVAGIDSYPVLISAGKASRIVHDVPSLSYFNHMILAVDGGKNKELIWLDPTAHTCAYGDFPASDQNRWTLIINTDVQKADDVALGAPIVEDEILDGEKVKQHLYAFRKSPMLPANTNIRQTETHVIVKSDRSLEVTHELRVSGEFNSRLRARLLTTSHREERIQFLRNLFELDERARVDDFEISNITEMRPELQIKLTWSCQEYLYEIADQFILELPVVSNPYAKLLRDEDRDHPAVLGKALIYENHTTVDVEAPYTISMIPQDNKLQTDVAEIQLSYKKSNKKAEMKQVVRFNVPTVDATKIEQLTDVVKIASSKSTKRFILTQEP